MAGKYLRVVVDSIQASTGRPSTEWINYCSPLDHVPNRFTSMKISKQTEFGQRWEYLLTRGLR